ncbi:MAG: DUF3180 domain-containing protein [Actinobacteria bacterium]|nr:DUF3180 domain-containing protein [Actinomycetota bacterium]
MAATRWRTLLGIAVVLAAITWYLLRLVVGQGGVVPSVGWLVLPVELIIALIVLRLGWAVRQYLHGRRPDLDPVRAARTAVLAKAACYTGALLLGFYGGTALALLSDLAAPGNGGRAGSAGLAAAGALVLAIAGLVVERFCRVPPPSADGKDVAGTPEPGPVAG